MKTEANQKGIKEDSKPWGTKNDLPPDEIEKLVINYLKKHGESEEWEIITCVRQKTPNVRVALNNVAKITRTERIDAATKTNYWNIKDEGEDIW